MGNCCSSKTKKTVKGGLLDSGRLTCNAANESVKIMPQANVAIKRGSVEDASAIDRDQKKQEE